MGPRVATILKVNRPRDGTAHSNTPWAFCRGVKTVIAAHTDSICDHFLYVTKYYTLSIFNHLQQYHLRGKIAGF